jgi:hypothetical protein
MPPVVIFQGLIAVSVWGKKCRADALIQVRPAGIWSGQSLAQNKSDVCAGFAGRQFFAWFGPSVFLFLDASLPDRHWSVSL